MRPLPCILLFLTAIRLAAVETVLGQIPQEPWEDEDRMALWVKTAQSPRYAEATAADPLPSDTALWPTLTGAEACFAQTWDPPKRRLAWATPGVDGPKKDRDPDASSPARWIDLATGKPATELPDIDTDLVFPAAARRYRVEINGKNGYRLEARHITVHDGASVVSEGMRVTGNIWVKRDAGLSCGGSLAFVGSRHTWYRNDNPSAMSAQYFTFDKGEIEASVEFFGRALTLDEWRLHAGTVIVGADSAMRPGRNATPFITARGRLVLMDNAIWAKVVQEFHENLDLDCQGGQILGGLPERPLRRDAYFCLSERNWKKVDFSPFENPEGKHALTDKRVVSAVFAKGSVLRTHAAPGSTARLWVTRTPLISGVRQSWENQGGVQYVGFYRPGPDNDNRVRENTLFENPEFAKLWLSLGHRTMAFFQRGVEVDGIGFDRFGAGGFVMQDPTEAKAWKNVAFGPGNAVTGDDLFRQADRVRQVSRGGQSPD